MIAYGRSLCLVHFTRYRQLAHYYRYALAHYYHKWVAHSRQWLDMMILIPLVRRRHSLMVASLL